VDHLMALAPVDQQLASIQVVIMEIRTARLAGWHTWQR
jgi:hypothetical protein